LDIWGFFYDKRTEIAKVEAEAKAKAEAKEEVEEG